jgi:hypothetical protein
MIWRSFVEKRFGQSKIKQTQSRGKKCEVFYKLDYKLIIYNLKKTPQDFQFKLN